MPRRTYEAVIRVLAVPTASILHVTRRARAGDRHEALRRIVHSLDPQQHHFVGLVGAVRVLRSAKRGFAARLSGEPRAETAEAVA